MPDIRELGRLVKAKYPGSYDSLDDAELGRRVKAKYPGAYDQFVDTPTEPLGVLGNLKVGGQRFLRGVGDTAQAAGELVTSTLSGDFRPAKELGELAYRNALPFLAGGAAGGSGYSALSAAQAAPIAEVNAQRQARREAGPDAEYWKRSREDVARLNALAAQDPSMKGKLLRGGVKVGGDVLLAGLLGGTSVPGMMASGAVMSLNEPENLIPNVALGALGGASARAIPRGVGKGAAEILDAEATAAARGTQMVLPGMEGMVEASVAKAAARQPWQDVVLSYYRANLLTNPAGRASDLGSTIINQFADAATRPIAAAVDFIVSKGTGARSITGPSLRGTAEAFGSLGQGLKDAGRVLKTGAQALESGAEGAYGSEMLSGLGKAVDAPINGVFRMLGALDAPFRRFGYARNLYDRARVAAINEGKRGAELSPRIRELLDDHAIIRAAVRDGEAAVLSEPNKISSWLASQTHASPNARLAIGLVQPFMRIPLNAVLKAADFSGLGGVKAMYKIARGVGRKATGQRFFRDLEEQRVFSQNVASGSFAPAAFLLGMELEDRGKLDGYYFTGKRDFPAAGRTPTSINIGGDSYDINRLGGFIAAPMLVGATYNRLRKQNASKADALLRSFSGLVQTAPSLGYYGAPAKLGRLLTSDEPGNVLLQEAGSTAAGFIPASGAAGYAAKAIDSGQKRQEQGFLGPIMSRVPGLRQRLPLKEGRRRK